MLIMIRERFHLAVFQPYMYTLSQTLNGCSKGNGRRGKHNEA